MVRGQPVRAWEGKGRDTAKGGKRMGRAQRMTTEVEEVGSCWPGGWHSGRRWADEGPKGWHDGQRWAAVGPRVTTRVGEVGSVWPEERPRGSERWAACGPEDDHEGQRWAAYGPKYGTMAEGGQRVARRGWAARARGCRKGTKLVGG